MNTCAVVKIRRAALTCIQAQNGNEVEGHIFALSRAYTRCSAGALAHIAKKITRVSRKKRRKGGKLL